MTPVEEAIAALEVFAHRAENPNAVLHDDDYIRAAQALSRLRADGEGWRPLVEKRIAGQTEWLRDNSPYCFVDQKHLDADSPERAYWHYGYLVALKDVLNLIDRPLPDPPRS